MTDGRAVDYYSREDLLEKDASFVRIGRDLTATAWLGCYTHLRAHETVLELVCCLMLEKIYDSLHAVSYTLFRAPATVINYLSLLLLSQLIILSYISYLASPF